MNTILMRFGQLKTKLLWPGIVWLTLSTIALCLPGKTLPDRDWFAIIQLDKWIHIGLFSVMVVLWTLPMLGRPFSEQLKHQIIYISIGWLIYGIAMELVQHYFIANRSFDLGDIAADAVGCLLAVLFVNKRQQMVFRWIGVKKGLIIGKFMPIHNGHIAMINFALSQCDDVTVSMSFTEHDPINADKSAAWIREIFWDNTKIRIQVVKDDFDNEKLSWDQRIKIWAAFVKLNYPYTNVVISSESYGPLLADALAIHHLSFDSSRTKVPVSATQIREKPFQYWDYIPKEVKPYFVKKICLYGPESTGKSSMAKRMAEVYHTEFVPEVAREMISSNDFTLEDIIKIGWAQTERVLQKIRTANKVLFCDSDLITTQIYCRHYLQEVPEVLLELERQIKYDLYFLFDIDVPWIQDGLRDLGNQRNEMFDVFKNELEARSIPYIFVKGNWEEREAIVRGAVNKLFS